MENQNLLQAMLFIAQSLNYPQTYKSGLIEQIESMIGREMEMEDLKNESELNTLENQTYEG